jgi:biopolymer transport protein ExbD
MHVRPAKSSNARIEQQMTPMIDVVFQLLTFFLLSFRVATLEGDFNVHMPVRGHEGNVLTPSPPPLKLRLHADAQGQLTSLALNRREFAAGDWRGVQSHLLQLIGAAPGPGGLQETLEIEIDCDYQLRYDHAIAAVTAVSGVRSESGQIVPLIERIKFTTPKSG